ncbi:replication-relaxation family protein [Corallococcus sp. AB038B]|uniref:replication-relaxation family protein n=1 Tax=Corallococcus sp. AB038B TaxID=2316718 RepID=UPI0013150D48|nr:replication-relaxation family protein [Corallococcus sp. AB038B]
MERIAQLRVITSAQAQWLYAPWRKKTSRNAKARLRQLTEQGYLRADKARPARGRAALYFYQLTHRGLSLLGMPPTSTVLARPEPAILDYLLLRNDVWAAFRCAGFEVVTPVLLELEHHPRALAVVAAWAKLQAHKHLVTLQRDGAAPDALEKAQKDVERSALFAPKELTFSFAYRLTAKKLPEDLVLLVVDDPRRAVARKGRAAVGRAKRAQVEELPLLGYHGDRLLLRDSESRWDVALARLRTPSQRHAEWMAALRKRYGAAALATLNADFPDLWAHKFVRPGSSQHSLPKDAQ